MVFRPRILVVNILWTIHVSLDVQSPKLHQKFQCNTLAVYSRSEQLLMLQMSFLFMCYKIVCHIHIIKKFLLSSITLRSFSAELMSHQLFHSYQPLRSRQYRSPMVTSCIEVDNSFIEAHAILYSGEEKHPLITLFLQNNVKIVHVVSFWQLK